MHEHMPKHTNTQAACPLFPQHFQHELAEATSLVTTLGLQGGIPPSCGKRRRELQRAKGYPWHVLAREEEETVWSRKKGTTGESRTPVSRERTGTMMVIREGGEIGQEGYTLTSSSKTENQTACLE